MKNTRLLSKLILVGASAFAVLAQAQAATMEVWKSPTCGCCNQWISYMKNNGFEVKVHETGNAKQHQLFGIKDDYVSCHTAVVDGYVIEGHVPAEDVKRLLAEKPDAIGLSAPGMPVGSPGMDGPAYQGRKDAYDVLLLKKNGESEVFSSHNQE
ncbi:DUF411 domain-containing protein [Gallibacterium genomosp. 3]|uniref:Metal-binding protein n=1 Tax=Gallibacterium genomosp. 3 TaxID=505345 RepID=A0A1A7Q0F1_9PAST|nr:DUF411 domain-containing protein [Gallibacterium genomosp. 3]OBX07422.1 metal-binding protein [Gallibacterium genomosp. 3]